MSTNITTLITGAGAVKNAWEPIIRLLSKYEDTRASFDEKLANSYFAQLIYRLRFHFSDKNKSDGYEQIFNQYRLLKVAIPDYLDVAQQRKELKIRSQFGKVLDSFVLDSQSKLRVINMNWDTVVDKALNEYYKKEIEVIHLHGCITGRNLYFPSEIVREPYRSTDDIEDYEYLHSDAINVIKESRRIILYGISLDPLDAELLTTIWAGISDNLEDIIIVSLSEDLSIISNRIKLVLGKKSNIRIVGYTPDDLFIGQDLSH